tara:strand:- start:214 stop:618 length:405 start_codon:yes stop_codon:yes gene_type:complete
MASQPIVDRSTSIAENEKKFRKGKKFPEKKFKGDVLRDLKTKIKELNFRESKDRPKTVENKQLPKGMNIGNSLKDLEKEFKNRFGKEEIKPPRRPGEKQEMQPLSKGGRAGYKAGTRGCKLATKGKGRAYGKNS